MPVYSYICGLTFSYICRFYRLLKYLFCFQCIPLPRQLVKHRAKQRNHHNDISSPSLAVQDPCLHLISYLGPTAAPAPAPPRAGVGARGRARVCGRKWERRGEKEEQHFVFLQEPLGEEPTTHPAMPLLFLYHWGQRAVQVGSRD